MNTMRENELLRAFVKMEMRKKGLQFQKNLTQRRIGLEVKEFNEVAVLKVPVTVPEFCELYLQIMKELVTEHFAMVEKKMSEGKGIPNTDVFPGR